MTLGPLVRFAPLGAVVVASVLFGTTGTAKTFAPDGVTPLSLGMARILVGGTILWLVSVAGRRHWAGNGASLSEMRSARRSSPLLLIGLGAAGVIAYQPSFFAGTEANGVALGTVVALGSAPLLTGLLAWAVSRRVPGVAWWIATAAAIVGVVLLSQVFSTSSSGSVSASGLLASVGAGASYAVYTVAAKSLIDRGWSSGRAMGAVFGCAAVAAIPLLAFTDIGWLGSARGIAVVLWLGVVATGIAYVLFGWGLASLSAPTVATVTLVEPLTATLLGVFVVHEVLAADQVVGMVLLVAGVIVLAVASANAQVRQGNSNS